jgi:hypothetical protein
MYLEQVATLSYRKRVQRDLRAGVGHGAGGLAYSLLRIHAVAPDASLLETAQRWLDSALAGAHRGALRSLEPTPPTEPSFLHGFAGLHVVRALVADARGEGALRAKEAAKWAQFAAQEVEIDELLFGTAGHLLGALAMHRALGDARALEVADALLTRLSPPDLPAWTLLEETGFGHGRAGILHALVRGLIATKRSPPAWLPEALDRVHADSAVRPVGEPAWRVGSLCGGSSGAAMLWSRAFELTREAAYLERARDAALASLAPEGIVVGHICCGAAGRAYAQLAVERVDPGGGWAPRAMDAMTPWLGPLATEHPLGLLQGYAGVACLAVDLGWPDKKRAMGLPLLDDG